MQDIFHNYKEELSHNSSTQLQLIPCLLLAVQPVPAPASVREMDGAEGISPGSAFHAGSASCVPRAWAEGWCQPLQWGATQGPTRLGGRHAEGNSQGSIPRPQQHGTAHPPTTPSSPPRASSAAAAQHQGECVWDFLLVPLLAASPAWHWSQQHPGTGCLCTTGGGWTEAEPGHLCHLWW